MDDYLHLPAAALAVGTLATAIMDVWGALQSRAFGARPMNYAFVGRWIGHIRHGTLRHDAIGTAPPVRGELLIGWTAHYAVGIAFAALLLAIWGVEWVDRPTLWPALVIGVGTVVFPFFVLQPALGLGVAASRTPQPNRARVRSLVTHAVFGVGLYLGALLVG